MIIVKVLLVMALTLVWAVFSFAVSRDATSYMPLAAVTAVYGALLYMAWPLGTDYSDVAGKRLFYLLGVGAMVMALDAARNHTCIGSSTLSDADGLFDVIITLTCRYLGTTAASLVLGGLGAYLIYRGVTFTPDPVRKRRLRKEPSEP